MRGEKMEDEENKKNTQKSAPLPLIITKLVAEAWKFEFPFALSLAASGQTLIISLMLAQVGETAVAAGVFIAALQNFVIGGSRAALQANSLLAGPINGRAKQKEKDGDQESANAEYEKIGGLIRQGWIFSTLLSIGAIACLSSSAFLFNKVIGINKAITDQVDLYFFWYSMGIWPLLHSFVDQQLAVAIKEPWLPIVRGPMYAGVTYGLGFLFLSGYAGDYFQGTRGIGLSAALAAWVVFLGTKIVHRLPFISKYALYRLNFTEGCNTFRDLTKLGGKLGTLVLTEWSNLMGIALIVGQLDSQDIRSVGPAMQLMTTISLFCFGWTASAASLLSNTLGEIQAVNRDDPQLIPLNQKLALQGNIAIFSGLTLPLLIAGVGIVWPDILTMLLLHKSASPEEHQQANNIMRMVLAGAILDGGRILSSAPLRAFNDILFPALIGCLCMTIFGLSASGLTLLTGTIGLMAFFAIRNGTTIPPTLFNLHRWFQYKQLAPGEKLKMQEIHLQDGVHCKSIWTPVSKLKNLLYDSQDIETRPLIPQSIFQAPSVFSKISGGICRLFCCKNQSAVETDTLPPTPRQRSEYEASSV